MAGSLLDTSVTIADVDDGHAIRVTDYWGEPFEPPAWRASLAEALKMPRHGVWRAGDALQGDEEGAAVVQAHRVIAAVASGRCSRVGV